MAKIIGENHWAIVTDHLGAPKVMLDENGMVFQDIFVEDNLHMNKKGYDLWAGFLGEYLK